MFLSYNHLIWLVLSRPTTFHCFAYFASSIVGAASCPTQVILVVLAVRKAVVTASATSAYRWLNLWTKHDFNKEADCKVGEIIPVENRCVVELRLEEVHDCGRQIVACGVAPICVVEVGGIGLPLGVIMRC